MDLLYMDITIRFCLDGKVAQSALNVALVLLRCFVKVTPKLCSVIGIRRQFIAHFIVALSWKLGTF